MRDAGRERAAKLAQRSNRPSQRRTARGHDSRAAAVVQARMSVSQGDSGSATVSFVGLASAYEKPYEMYDYFGPYEEVVSAGAGSKSLARADLDVPLVLQHDPLRRLARTTNGSLTLTETAAGLEVRAPHLSSEDRDVAYIIPKLEAGLIDEMSFAFRIVRGSWSPDYTEYRIDEYDIHRGDVAIVGYGANPATAAELRQPVKTGRELISIADTRMVPLVPR